MGCPLLFSTKNRHSSHLTLNLLTAEITSLLQVNRSQKRSASADTSADSRSHAARLVRTLFLRASAWGTPKRRTWIWKPQTSGCGQCMNVVDQVLQLCQSMSPLLSGNDAVYCKDHLFQSVLHPFLSQLIIRRCAPLREHQPVA